MKISDTPFCIVAFAPLLTDSQQEQQNNGVPLLVESADQGLSLLVPSLYIPLPRTLSPDCGIQLEFRKLDDFTPESIVARTPWLKALAVGSEQERKQAGGAVKNDPLDSILEMVSMSGETADSADTDSDRMTEADIVLAGVLNRVFTDSMFRQTEAAWRGVAMLLDSGCCGSVSLSVVPVLRDTAVEVMERVASSLDDNPPDLLLLDACFDATPAGMLLLESISILAERLMSPALCWCGSGFFSNAGWNGLNPLPYLPNHLDGFVYARWKTLRSRPAAFWTMATCNGFIIRKQHSCTAQAGFFKENSGLIAAPVWGTAALMLKAATATGNPGRAASQTLQAQQNSDSALSTEADISAERRQQLLACGILPLVSLRENRIGIPGLVTIDRGNPAKPVALSWAIHKLIQLKNESVPVDDGDLLAIQLQNMFSEYFQTGAFSGIEMIQTEYAGTGRNGAIVLAVKIRPSGAEQTELMEFTFDW